MGLSSAGGIGESLPRREDPILLRGAGRFIDDIDLPGQAHAWFVRSPHPHARIVSIETANARSAPGVRVVFIGEDLVRAGVGDMTSNCSLRNQDGSPIRNPGWTALARDRVRHVGDTVAMVVAETPAAAREAAERVEVEYDPMPSVTDPVAAVSPASPLIWDELGSNVALDWVHGDAMEVGGIFASAAHVARVELVNNRIVVAAMETRGALAQYERASSRLVLYTPTQGGTAIQLATARSLGLQPSQVRVITPDVGGSFGNKAGLYPEQVLVGWAAKCLGRPVKWYAERADSFLADFHARDHWMIGELALDADARFLAIRCEVVSNMGAYLTPPAPFIPTEGGTRMLANVYRIPSVYAHTRCVFTNTTPIGAYRGAGKPEFCHLVERLVTVAAREVGLDPIELRRRNLIGAAELPYRTPLDLLYDSGDFERTMDDALALAATSRFDARRAEARSRGKLRGLGVSVYIEPDGYKDNRARLLLEGDGSLIVTSSASSNGQGYETIYPQITATLLGLPVTRVRFEQGDTDRVGAGGGNGGSRSTTVTGAAIAQCVKLLIEQGRTVAADLMEVSPADVEYRAGVFSVVGTDRRISLEEVAVEAASSNGSRPDESRSALATESHYDAPAYCFPSGCHVCEVEIDDETGATALVSYASVSDHGVVVNPLLLEGQLHGGIAQGVGQVLFEEARYDAETGQLLSGSFMDYCIPRASQLPFFAWGSNPTECRTNPLGVKGVGESGTTASLPAVMNAVVDALRDFDTTALDMPVTAEKVWRIIRQA